MEAAAGGTAARPKSSGGCAGEQMALRKMPSGCWVSLRSPQAYLERPHLTSDTTFIVPGFHNSKCRYDVEKA